MSEILSYQDPQLIPSDVYEPDMDAEECYETCAHHNACVSLLMRLNGLSMVGASRAATMMGCADCYEWAEA